MHENSPFLLSKIHHLALRNRRSSTWLSLVVAMTLVPVTVPSALAREAKRIYLPAEATEVTIARIYSSVAESTNPADQRTELRLEEYGRASRRISPKRIPSVAVVIQFRAPSQTITRPLMRGGLEESVTSAVLHRTVHFTTDLKSRSFQLVPKGRITSTTVTEDASQCWQRSPSWMDSQYSYGCRGPSVRSKVEMLVFDVLQN